jgi:hypothetical protein
MGFTIGTYQLLGLPALPNIYVTIKGSYAVKKQLDTYIITFTTYFQASQEDPVITQKDMCFSIQALPNPAVLYLIIYDYIKGQLRSAGGELDPQHLRASRTLNFIDD